MLARIICDGDNLNGVRAARCALSAVSDSPLPTTTSVPTVVSDSAGAQTPSSGPLRPVWLPANMACLDGWQLRASRGAPTGSVRRPLRTAGAVKERALIEGDSGSGAATGTHPRRKGHRRAEGHSGTWSYYVRGALQFVATAAFFGLLSEMHRRRGLKARKAAKEERAKQAARAKKEGGDGEGKPVGRQDFRHGDDGISDEDW